MKRTEPSPSSASLKLFLIAASVSSRWPSDCQLPTVVEISLTPSALASADAKRDLPVPGGPDTRAPRLTSLQGSSPLRQRARSDESLLAHGFSSSYPGNSK